MPLTARHYLDYTPGMTSLAPVPAPIFCRERQRLISEYTVAASEHLQALSAQLKAVADGDGFVFEAEIHATRDRKDEAKYAVLQHQEQHGCSQ
jgi:hypothetical protein